MSHSNPLRIIIIVLALILTLLAEHQSAGSVGKASTLSDARRKEIEKLRAELSEALEAADEQNPVEEGIVIQPTWTSQQANKSHPKLKANVEVTQQRIDEVNALRAEIYAPTVQQTDNDRYVQELVKEFSTQQTTVNKSVQSTYHTHDELASATSGNASAEIPNIVEANIYHEYEFDARKLEQLRESQRSNRETLILTSVEEDFNFNLGEDVQQWVYTVHNGTEYFVGRREHDLLIVRTALIQYQSGRILEVGQTISYMLTYWFWNVEQAQQESVITLASADKVIWYRDNDDTKKLELYWQWVVGTTISGLTHFAVGNNNYLIVSSNESSRSGFYTVNIYQFDLNAREFWIVQRMQLQYPCAATTFLDTGRDLLLAIPQNNSAMIYTFNPRVDTTDYLHFQLKHNITSEGIESVAGFQMGGRSYLALGGDQPQILVYQQGELVPKTILGQNYGRVQMFFPVPVRTYRDDLILFVQHQIDFSTHSLIVLETLIWDGDAFQTSLPTPCHQGKYTVYGVSCMLDIQRDEGLKGAAMLLRDDKVTLIVPRLNAVSGLFHLHTELLAKNSDTLDLQEIFEFLKDWVKEQDDLITQAQHFLQAPYTPQLSELEELHTPELIIDEGEVGEIYVNDYKWTDADTKTDLEEVLVAIEQLEAELNNARRKRDVPTEELNFEHLEFDDLNVEELLVQRVNGNNFYVQQGELDFEGLLNVRNLEVLNYLNGFKAREAFIEEDEVESDTLIFDGDMEFETINGITWNDFKDNLVFTNEPLELATLDVDGQLIVEDKLSLDTLNSLNFPDDFLWSSGPALSVVTAEKTFTNTLSANTVHTKGLLNGLNASDAITLTDPQEWRGLPTFTNLKITELFQLNGTTRGRDIENIPHNPTLKDANQVNATCHFKQLQVDGAIHLNSFYAGQSLARLLHDVVQRPEQSAAVISIHAKKRFSKVEMPIDFVLLDGKLNDIVLELFVPGHTKQNLQVSILQAHVYFTNLTLSGRFDGVDIAELMRNAIKIDEPQTTPLTQLSFAAPLQGTAVRVLTLLNDVPVATGYQTIYEDINIPVAYFEQLQASQAVITNDIRGTANTEHCHNNGQHAELGNIYIDELTLAQDLIVDKIQGVDAKLLWRYFDDIDDLSEMMIDGKIKLDHLLVTGDIYVHKLNQQHFDEDLQLTTVWLNRPNHLNTNLQFNDPVAVQGNLQVEGTYNGQHLQNVIDDMIFRIPANNTIQVLAPKSFAQPINVLGNTDVKSLNGMLFADIATTKTFCNFRGSVQLYGNLVVQDLELMGSLNDYPMNALNGSIHYDRRFNAFVVQGIVNFNTLQTELDDLTIYGQLNEIPTLAGFFSDLCYKNKGCILEGRNIFTGRVSIEEGAYIRKLNSYNLLALFANIIYTNELQPQIIKSPLRFKGPVRAQDILVQQSLTAVTLNDDVLQEWYTDTLRLDRPQQIGDYLIFAPGSLNGNSFYASYLNDIDLSEIITLNTAQNLKGNITFSELYLNGHIQTRSTVNGVDLQEEYKNTFLTHGIQRVSTPLTLQFALVQQDLQTKVPLNNGKDLRRVATLECDQLFESSLLFHNLTTQNLQIKYPISDILNLEERLTRKFTLQKPGRPQKVNVDNLSAPNYMQGRRAVPQQFVSENRDYEDLCETLGMLMQKQQRRGYYLQYFVEAFKLSLHHLFEHGNRALRKVFVLAQDQHSYLLINTGCRSNIMKWNYKIAKYEKLGTFESGYIDQAILLPNSEGASPLNIINFITNGVNKTNIACAQLGLNYWRLQNDNLSLLKHFTQPASELMISARIPPEELYVLHADGVYAYELDQLTQTNSWLLPSWLDNYRFVPQTYTHTLMLTNGVLLLLFGDEAPGSRKKRTYAPILKRIPFLKSAQNTATNNNTLLHKSNASKINNFDFADFRPVIVEILDELNYQLTLEVNITQLSIPETDLYDKHLLPDFHAIIEELQSQQIFTNATFDSIPFDELPQPHNPAQILAMRAVLLLWPTIVDIGEIQGYLHKANDTNCASIKEHIGATIRDIFVLAKSKALSSQRTDSNNSAAHVGQLDAVIKRIRRLQHFLEGTVQKLKPHAQTDSIELHARSNEDLLTSNNNNVVVVTRTPRDRSSKGTWFKFHNLSLEGEMLPIIVGSPQARLHLLAATSTIRQLVGERHDEIILYMDIFSGRRFQTIYAHTPRSLSTIHIGTETLFAFVERCCAIRVLIYRGVQGFIDFARFDTRKEISEMFIVALKGADELSREYYLVAVHADGLLFYRFVGVGSTLLMSSRFICS